MNTFRYLITFISSVLIHQYSHSQEYKQEYLQNNSSVLDESYVFPLKDAKIIGFGAYHGSSLTEIAELQLLQSVHKSQNISFYFPETDISLAHYFNEYLKTGNENLLKDLIEHYGTRIPQEKTIDVLEKWKVLKKINDKLPEKNKITVLGADPIVTYKYTYKHLLEIIKNHRQFPLINQLETTFLKDTTDYSPYYDSYSKTQLKSFVADYDKNSGKYLSSVKEKELLEHIIRNIKTSFVSYNREKEIYSNYINLRKIYSIKNQLQFFRYGFFHLLKTKEGKHETFFSMLIKNNIYHKESIVSVLGYLTESEVMVNTKFDDNDNFTSQVNEGGNAIGDAPDEYFKGIDNIKTKKLSDLTIFWINTPNSPYHQDTDLIEVIEIPQKRKIDYGNSTTTDFIDFAILISNSKASKSIYSQP
ncbi:TraB/GumN family protein [Flavobacterium hauense]